MANVKGFFQKAFPFISAGLSLGGPLGNTAAAILGKVIGKPDLTHAGVEDALAGLTLTPELQAQLKEAELAYQQQMTALGFKDAADMLSLDNADRESARAREIAVKDKTPSRLAWTIVIAGLVLCGFLVSNHSSILKDATMAGFAGTVLGYIMGDMKQIIAYYFGSSSGSDRKTELMAGNGHS
jgi:hypothetical protein